MSRRWTPSPDLPLLEVTDTRSARWKAAEARIAKSWLGIGNDPPDPDDMRIIDEEQAAFDAAHRAPPP